jgi:hypothetical protein
MRNKKESGLERTFTVESEDIPRIGDTVIYRGDDYHEIYEGNVYKIFRNVVKVNEEGVYVNENEKGKVIQHTPIIRVLVR